MTFKTVEGHDIVEGECYETDAGEKIFVCRLYAPTEIEISFGNARPLVIGINTGKESCIMAWQPNGRKFDAFSPCPEDIMRPWSEWKPIETAPRDRTSVLITNGKCIHIAYYSEGAIWFGASDDWYAFDMHDGEPTHWMPLPKLPQEGIS